MFQATCSILHLSDLHRDVRSELDSDVLAESMLRDIRRYATNEPAIRFPDLCVVTGDLVYGAGGEVKDYTSELRRQYGQAERLLVRLADELFEGRRDRLVLLPGNHDVCYNTTISSCIKIDAPAEVVQRKSLMAEFFSPNSLLRWSWEELCYYKIQDTALYGQRLACFSEFYTRFYGGARRYSLFPDEQIDIFPFPQSGFAVFALNSCFNNDPLRRGGAFSPACIARVSREARKLIQEGYLLIGAWHHNLSGGPQADDYLDPDSIRVLLDLGISIGLHGHQHRSQVMSQHRQIGNDERFITVISAGTLGGGAKQLAPGEARSYNIIELSDAETARVHQRRMLNVDFLQPVWAPGYFVESLRSYVEYQIPKLTTIPEKNLEIASKLISEKKWSDALAALEKSGQIPLARPLIMEACRQQSDWDRCISLLWPPISLTETIEIGYAIIEAGNGVRARQFLELPFVLNEKDANLSDVVRRLRYTFKL